jgi:transposase InsO family protein
VRVLTRLAAERGLPAAIVLDNGPEFVGRTLDAWVYAHGVALRIIRPGQPIENAYLESFNGHFRDECLKDIWRPVAIAQPSIVSTAMHHSAYRGIQGLTDDRGGVVLVLGREW